MNRRQRWDGWHSTACAMRRNFRRRRADSDEEYLKAHSGYLIRRITDDRDLELAEDCCSRKFLTREDVAACAMRAGKRTGRRERSVALLHLMQQYFAEKTPDERCSFDDFEDCFFTRKSTCGCRVIWKKKPEEEMAWDIIQTQEEWEAQMAEKILSYVRNELYLEMRYLDVAFSALVPQADASLQSFATDGDICSYSTEQVLRVFEKNAPYLNRAYLHIVLHCIFSPSVDCRGTATGGCGISPVMLLWNIRLTVWEKMYRNGS